MISAAAAAGLASVLASVLAPYISNESWVMPNDSNSRVRLNDTGKTREARPCGGCGYTLTPARVDAKGRCSGCGCPASVTPSVEPTHDLDPALLSIERIRTEHLHDLYRMVYDNKVLAAEQHVSILKSEAERVSIVDQMIHSIRHRLKPGMILIRGKA